MRSQRATERKVGLRRGGAADEGSGGGSVDVLGVVAMLQDSARRWARGHMTSGGGVDDVAGATAALDEVGVEGL